MQKIAINCDYGGFGLSDWAFEKLLERKGIAFEKQNRDSTITHYYQAGHIGDDEFYLSPYDFCYDRSDVDLIAVIEELGDKANAMFSSLKIVEIPDDVKWHVAEYDGSEWVAEDHRKWY